MAIWDRLGKVEKCLALIMTCAAVLALVVKAWTMSVTEPTARRVVHEEMRPVVEEIQAIKGTVLQTQDNVSYLRFRAVLLRSNPNTTEEQVEREWKRSRGQ